MAKSITLRNVTISFPSILNPKTDDNGVSSYGAQIIIDKSHPQIAALQGIIDNCLRELFPKGNVPAAAKRLLRDGGEPKMDGSSRDPITDEHFFFNAKAYVDNKPAVVDSFGARIDDPSMIVAGGLVNVALYVTTFSTKDGSNKGVRALLNGVQVILDESGEPKLGPLGRLDDKPTVEQMFGTSSAPVQF